MIDESVAWERFMAHLKSCPACVRADANGVLCREGVELHHAWGHADRHAAQLAHIDSLADATGNDSDLDCAQDSEFMREAQREAFE